MLLLPRFEKQAVNQMRSVYRSLAKPPRPFFLQKFTWNLGVQNISPDNGEPWGYPKLSPGSLVKFFSRFNG